MAAEPALHLPGVDTNRLLYEPVLYRAQDRSWHPDFFKALGPGPGLASWDPAAILSLLSFNYVCGDRTLLGEIARKPWLSRIGPDGEPVLLSIPPQDTIAQSHERIAEQLENLLCQEIVSVCSDRSQIYLLLSGGLDSRVVAGVTARAAANGLINAPMVAVTWGLPNCRDVVYAKATAEILGLEWIHLDCDQQHLLESVEDAARSAAALVSPIHLHRVTWFRDLDPAALVLAGSYGDSVGRAEFSELHLLELGQLNPADRMGLMKAGAYRAGRETLLGDLRAFRRRGSGRPPFALAELEMQGHYMRGLISHAMNIIGNYCTVYQVFTSPKIYGYMWSIHPALRSNRVYAILLERLDPRLARLPWARTNRALQGKTCGAHKGLRRCFQDYNKWVSGPLYEQLRGRLDIDWLDQTGIFRPQAVQSLCKRIENQSRDNMDYEMFTWLVALQRFGRLVEESGKRIRAIEADQSPPLSDKNITTAPPPTVASRLRKMVGYSPLMQRVYRRFLQARQHLLRRKALRMYPPKQPS